MKLHTVFITYNRLELTKQAIESYLETVTVPFTMVIADNGSTDGTVDWIRSQIHPHWSMEGLEVWLTEFRENMYPGYACNHGWSGALPDATHLHRADNDFAFLPGWCEEIEHIFQSKKVGQIGLRTDEEEMYARWNVGGNCVIRRELWDKGLRYDERPWTEYPPGYSEDSFLSPAVEALGYTWTRVRKPCIRSLASGDLSDPYYQKSYGDRRIFDPETIKRQLGTE